MFASGTIVVILPVAGGFAIAADGRSRTDSTIMSDEVQKIFSVTTNEVNMAYALVGLHGMRLSPPFDFLDVMAMEIPTAARIKPKSVEDFVRLFSRRLARALLRAQDSLFQAHPDHRLPDDDGKGSVADIFLAGFFRTRPAMIRVHFYQRRNRIASVPQISIVQDPTLKDMVLAGPSSRAVYGFLLKNDTRLAEFNDAAFSRLAGYDPGLTLAEAIRLAEKITAAHCSDTAGRITPRLARYIGGHTHAAVVTRESGFQWARPPRGRK